MRKTVLLLLVLLLSGCLGTQLPASPKAPPVVSKEPVVEQSKVERMKELFLTHFTAERKFLGMAPELTPDEMVELNLWMEQFGIQLQLRKKQAPSPFPYGEPDTF